MKKISLLLLLAIFSISGFSQNQQIKILSFTVKNTLPESVDSWLTTPGALILTAQKIPGSQVRELLMVVQIRNGAAVICGNSMSNANPLNPVDVRVFNTADLTATLINCRTLKAGTYSICVQFFNSDKSPASQEVCKDFRVDANATDFALPTLITPENGKKITMNALMQPIQFRWTPLVPIPKEPVTYRLRVWQLMQGQNGTAAMRSNQPIVDKEVKNITQTTVTNLLNGPCKPPYLCDFVWTVQVAGLNGKPLGNNNQRSELWSFSVTHSETIRPPINTYPEDKKSLNLDEAKKSVTFKWKPVEPDQNTPVFYKLRVWQLMKGQTAAIAMNKNKPLIEKEVLNNNEFTVQELITGPCKPPYLCDFIWNVEASVRQVKDMSQVIGISQATTFLLPQYIIQLDSIKVKCTTQPGVFSFSFSLTNVNPGTAILTNFVVTSSVPAGASLSTFSPPLGTNIGSGNQLTINGTINGPATLSNICIGAEITDATNSFWKASKDTCTIISPCNCDACDDSHFILNAPPPSPINWSNNTLSFNQLINISTNPAKTVKSIRAELVYYEMTPLLANCLPCNKESLTYGHFTNGTNSQQWNGPQTSLSINITTPEVPCCSTHFKWCIRYKIEFTDCTVCSKLICYEKDKDGCVPAAGGKPIINNPKQ